MQLKSLLARILGVLLLLLSGPQLAFSQTDTADFSDAYERIFQIRVVSQDAGGKSAIGSGFQVSEDGLIITNYHVVSEFVNSPDHYQIKYVTHDGKTGFLQLLDFDIVHDLAVLRHPEPARDHFSLANKQSEKGTMAYALGNPGDWGIVMVPGPTNGVVEHRYEERILFSGSLNGGMSGGPSVNEDGEVMGVNVATAGSQLSFLVPVEKIKQLLSRQKKVPPTSFNVEMTSQIRSWQRGRIQDLLDTSWADEVFIGKPLFGEIRKDFQCWGDTNDTDTERTVARVSRSCRAGDSIYISPDLNAGQIEFSFESLKPVKLNEIQFARNQYLGMWAINDSDYEHSTNFVCETDFISAKENDGQQTNRIITCVRAHKKMPGLYDSMMLVMSSTATEVFKSRLSLSAVEKEQILDMNHLFVERSL